MTTWMRPREKTGRDTWACRLVGGSQNPRDCITAKPARAVNALRPALPRPRSHRTSLHAIFIRCGIARWCHDIHLFAGPGAEAILDDQHGPRPKEKHQHDFAECSLVEAPKQLETEPSAGEQGRQPD